MNTEPSKTRTWVLTETSLVIKKDDLDPGNVTELLGMEPTGTRPAGGDRWARGGNTDGQWRWTVNEHTAREFSEQLDALLTVIEPKVHELHELEGQGYRVYVQIHGFAGNSTALFLSDQSVKRIADLGLLLELSPNMNER